MSQTTQDFRFPCLFSRSRVDCCSIFQNCVMKDYYSSKDVGGNKHMKRRYRERWVGAGKSKGICWYLLEAALCTAKHMRHGGRILSDILW